MSGSVALIHIGIAVVAVVVTIVMLRIEPVLALIFGALYLGVATGQGVGGTVETVASGFGEVMGEIGLLITFGVLFGSLIQALDVPQRIAAWLLAKLGPGRVPYAFGLSLGGLFPAVYSDVLIVMSGPLVRHASRRMGRSGHGVLSGAALIGILVGLVMVVPGAATMAIAGIMRLPLPELLLFGFPLGVATIVISVSLFGMIMRRGLWNPDKDEQPLTEPPAGGDAGSPGTGSSHVPEPDGDGGTAVASGSVAVKTEAPARQLPLLFLIAPLLLTLATILVCAILTASGVENPLVEILGNANVAVFLGLFAAYLLVIGRMGRTAGSKAIGKGMKECGSILVLTGVSGGLAAVVNGTGVGEELGDAFTAGAVSPVILAWAIAAILHAAVGSVSLGAITAAGVLAPVVSATDTGTPVLIALAAASGALFLGMPNANGFWLFRGVFGLTTSGALKTYTLAVSMASVVSLGLLLGTDVIL